MSDKADRPGPITEVHWIDSVGVGRWMPPEDHKPKRQELMHRSVGYVGDDSDLCLTLVQSVGGNGNWDNSISIPKVAILRRRSFSK